MVKKTKAYIIDCVVGLAGIVCLCLSHGTFGWLLLGSSLGFALLSFIIKK